MFELFRKDPFPRKVLIAFGALLAFTVLLVALARLTGYNPSPLPDSPAVQTRDLRFVDSPDGGALVQDVADGRTLAVLPPGSEGFVRGVLRALYRERKNASVSRDTAFRLARLADGRLNLIDLGTGRVIELRSFGPTNEGAFATYLGDATPTASVPGKP